MATLSRGVRDSAPARPRSCSQAAEAALAAGEGRERLGEIVGVEFGPHPLGEMQFGIGAFPEQEVGQPLLAAGADDEIDVAQALPRR